MGHREATCLENEVLVERDPHLLKRLAIAPVTQLADRLVVHEVNEDRYLAVTLIREQPGGAARLLGIIYGHRGVCGTIQSAKLAGERATDERHHDRGALALAVVKAATQEDEALEPL